MQKSGYVKINTGRCIFILLVIFILKFQIVFGQEVHKEDAVHEECGTPHPTEHQFKQMTVKALTLTSSDLVAYQSLRIIVVQKSDGTGGLSTTALNAAVATLNNIYTNSKIQFWVESTQYLSSDRFYNFYRSDESALVNAAGGDRTDMVNVYVIGTFADAGLNGFAYYPPGMRSIIRLGAFTNGTTFAHELGHFYSLPHTFGNSSAAYSTTELVNGSNCSSTGDRICDTPADPNAGVTNCKYTATRGDANGQRYNPRTDMLMSYYHGCRNKFSPQQESKVRSTAINHSSRSPQRKAPATPTALKATVSGSAIVLTWADNSQNESVFILTRTNGSNSSTFTINRNENTYTDNSALSGVTYTYSIQALNYDRYSNKSNIVTISRSGSGNISPNVSISTPINNSSFNAPATITIAANASDPDGSIAKVEFFAGTTKIGEDLTSPYSLVWSGVSAGNYSISAKATDNLLLTATSASVSVSVGGAMVQTPYGGKAALIPGKIETENFDLGGEGVAYHEIEEANRGDGIYRNEGVDIEKCLDAGGGFNVGYIRVGEWIEYTVQVQATGLYKVDLRVASFLTGNTIRLEMNGVSIGGNILIPNTGGWQTYQTVTLNNVSLNQGIQIMRLVAVSDDVNINHISFSSLQVNKLPAVSITSPIHNSTVNAPSNITINANAMDLDGNIAKLEFFQGTTKLGEDLDSPYSFLYSNVQAGNYELSVKAYDNSGGVGTSAPVFITLRASDACSMLPQYTEGSNYVAGTKVTNNGSQFECKEWPYSSWCNGASWAYEPGAGAYWTDAWYYKGACTAEANEEGDMLMNYSNLISIVPNPSNSLVSISFEQLGNNVANLELIDGTGVKILAKESFHSGATLDITSINPGVYSVLLLINNQQVYLKKIVKY